MTSIKIQIKSKFDDSILFECTKKNNTIMHTLVKAVRRGANLRGANLCYAYLCEANLFGADLRGTDICDANLCDADLDFAHLCDADLRGADLRDAKLRGTDLRDAYLCDADLRGAMLRGAKLRGAKLRNADLRDADLRDADLCDADLHGARLRGTGFLGANFCGANFCGASNIPYISLSCPSDGSFIGWTKVHGKLIKLEIPEDAKRSSATTNQCRCDKAKVLSITDIDGNNPINKIANEIQMHHITYKVGKMVYSDSFDEERWNECSHGIHFYIDKQDAINY